MFYLTPSDGGGVRNDIPDVVEGLVGRLRIPPPYFVSVDPVLRDKMSEVIPAESENFAVGTQIWNFLVEMQIWDSLVEMRIRIFLSLSAAAVAAAVANAAVAAAA